MCSSLLVKHGTIEMTAIIIIMKNETNKNKKTNSSIPFWYLGEQGDSNRGD